MAITLVGAPLVTEVLSDTVITLTYPTTAANNLLLLSITNSATGTPLEANTPAGWTRVIGQINGSGSGPTVTIYYKIATGSETGTFSMTAVNSAGRLTGVISQWSGVNTSIPFDVNAVGNGTAASTTYTHPSITTITNNTLIAHTIANNGSSASSVISGPGTVTKQSDTTDGVGRRTSLFTEYKTTAGVVGTRDYSSFSASLPWTGVTVALRPADGGSSAATPVLTRCINDIPTTTTMAMAVHTTDASSVRIKVGTNNTVTAGVIYGPAVIPDSQGNSQLSITGLTANTPYYYRIAMSDANSVEAVDTWSAVGQFKTNLDGQMNFSFAFSSCGNNADSNAMAAVAGKKPDLFLHLGDEYYADGSGTSLSNFRSKLIAKKTAANYKAVYRVSGSSFIPSDHDAMTNNGNNGSDPTAWTNYNTAYREINPNVGLPGSTGLYRTFTRGRVRFIRIDRRSFATIPSATDDATKTCLGTTQKQWLKDQITNSAETVIIIQNGEPWIGAAQAGDDGWFGYSTERTELANFFAASGKNIVMLGGDMHALAADNGTNAPGGIAVLQASPLYNSASSKGGPYTIGPYPTAGTTGVEQYGWVDIVDTGSQISVQFKGFSADNVERIALTETYEVITAASGTANFTGSGTLSAVSTGIGTSANFSGSGTLSATRSFNITKTAGLTGSGTLSISSLAASTPISNLGLYIVRDGELREVSVARTIEYVAPPVIGNWRLAFEDLFVGPTISNQWATSWFNGSSRNNVATSAANVSIVNNNLKLKLSSNTVGALVNTNPNDNTANGGFSFTTGYAEARIWFPGPADNTHIYNWPAWWINGQPTWPENGENNIAEPAGWAGGTNYMTVSHKGKNLDGTTFIAGSGTVPGAWANSWHTYAIHRKVGSADYYIDNIKVFTTVTKDNEAPQYLVLNIGSTPQATYESIGDAGAMLVDYVRVWVPKT